MGNVSQLIKGIIAIDGKQLRRSHDKNMGKGVIHKDVVAIFDYFEAITFKNIDHDYHKTVKYHP